MKSLIVSLHDVSPKTFTVSREILHDLSQTGIATVSLLVIPDHHHSGNFLKDTLFCTWLQEMEQAGHEIVTHGYFHQRTRNDTDSLRDKMITRFYTSDEGEFYDISEKDASDKMSRAQQEFTKLEIHPVGFIAPAWLLSKAGEMAARKTGFLYTTTLRSIINFQNNISISSQSLVYSVRNGWRRACSLIWNPLLAQRLSNHSVIRLGIHPPDWSHPKIRRQILHLATELGQSRTATTYASFVSSQPA